MVEMVRVVDLPVKERKLSRQYKKYEVLEIQDLNCYKLGERIRHQRTAKGLTRETLAERVGISKTYLADIEYGTKTTTIKNIYTIAKLLDLSMQYILVGTPSSGMTCAQADLIRIARNTAFALSQCSAHEVKSMEHMVRAFAATLPCEDSRAEADEDAALREDPGADKYLSKPHSPRNVLLLALGRNAAQREEDLILDLPAMAERIKKRRLALKFTRADIAEYLDIGEAYAADFEYGIKCMSLHKFYTLLHVLKTTADRLTGIRPAPIRFSDADSLASAAKIGNVVISCPQKEAEYLFGLVRTYVDALHGAQGTLPQLSLFPDKKACGGALRRSQA